MVWFPIVFQSHNLIKHHYEVIHLNMLAVFQSDCNYDIPEAQMISSVANGRLLKLAPRVLWP